MELKDIIKKQRKQLNLSMKELAKLLDVNEATVSRWESGNIANMRRDKIIKLSKVLNIPIPVIMGWSEADMKRQKGVFTIPLLGKVAAGIPIFADNNIEGYIDVPEEMANGEYYALTVRGDSMEPKIFNGDVVVVHNQTYFDSGDIVIVSTNGDDATCKRILQYGKELILHPLNSKYDDISLKDYPDAQVWGKVIELRRRI